jgi:iron(III) transport system substrate-binding protein
MKTCLAHFVILPTPKGWRAFLVIFSLLVLMLNGAAIAQQISDSQSRWQQVLDSAKKEGKVVVLAPSGDALRRAVTEGFRKDFPDIGLEYSGGRGSIQATKLLAERDGGIFSSDLLISGSTTALQLRSAGALAPIKTSLIVPEVTNLKLWHGNRLHFNDKEKLYDLGFVSTVSAVLVYNSKQVKRNEVDEPFKLLDPRWKGKIAINDPMIAGTGYTMFRHFWEKMGPKKAEGFFSRIKAQAAVVSRDQRLELEWVSQGKYPILLGPSTILLEQLLGKGLEFDVVSEWRDIGGFVTSSSSTVMLVDKAPHPNAAAVFINWLLSKDTQITWSKVLKQVSLRADVSSNHLPSYVIPEPTKDYWISSAEENRERHPDEERILKEVFGR